MLKVEELEPRVVLSVSTSLVPPLIQSVSTISNNWSGYAVETNLLSPQPGVFTAVSGSWTVPAVSGVGTAYSSVWVGLDGFSSGTVEQIGTASDLIDGVPSYYAWYEMYPSYSVSVTTLSIKPGDKIDASVIYTGSDQFSLVITNTTSSSTFSTVQTLKDAKRSSAEWIVEAPSSKTGVLPLADFGKVTVTSASASTGSKGTTGPIDSGSWQNASILMVSHGSTLATTSSVTDTTSTSSFTVTFTGASAAAPVPRRDRIFAQDNIPGSPDAIRSFLIASAGPSVSVANINQAVVPLAAPGLFAGPAQPQNTLATSSFLQGTSNGYGEIGIEEPLRNDADVLPGLLPPVQRPQALPAPINPETSRNVIRPAPTAPVGELSVREDTPPAVIDVREIQRPDTPAETREQRTGTIAKTMVSLLGIVASFTLFGEWKSSRADERKPLHRDRFDPR